MQGKRERPAFGHPGIEPRWTSGAKSAIGTAYSVSSKLWFTMYRGCLTEVYFPTIDTPQIRDLEFLITDGETFFHEERKSLIHDTEAIAQGALGVVVTSKDPQGRYTLRKEIITDPYQNCLLLHCTVEADKQLLKKMRLYVLCAPHLNLGGYGNNAEVIRCHGKDMILAWKGTTHMVMGASVPFVKTSVGYVGQSDGYQDLHGDFVMDWEFDNALDGNVALTAQIDLHTDRIFTLGLAFGGSQQHALATLTQSLATQFQFQRSRFIAQWDSTKKRVKQFEHDPGHSHSLYLTSINILLAHEDKRYPGAMIAGLSIPWGELKGDDELGGYHLVWVRDMCQTATALLAIGDKQTALRSLIYLAVSQNENGGFAQNFWIDGTPYWVGIQLDEIAFPIMLAWRVRAAGALQEFDPLTMTRGAVGFLIREGPITKQERWEEASGYSPSTLAACIAGLICGADILREGGDEAAAQFAEEYADFLEANIERWTVTTAGTQHPDIQRHYVRVNPVPMSADGFSEEDPNRGTIRIANQAPGKQIDFPAKEIVDAGFLELVRYGVRKAGAPLLEDSLKVVDRLLKVDTPYGPCWRRYNHDGYGQQEDGTGFVHYGVGRAWPLLTGERAHYELAAGRDAQSYMRAIENFASGIGLLPEQVWDEKTAPMDWLHLGGQTGAAIPLVWAHAEYVKLVVSMAQGFAADRLPPVFERYVANRKPHRVIDVWTKARRPRTVVAGKTLRFIASDEFMLRWSGDEWKTVIDSHSATNSLDVHHVDLEIPLEQSAPLRFTFYWEKPGKWEGQDFSVQPVQAGRSANA